MSRAKNISDFQHEIDTLDDDDFKEWDKKQKHKITGMFLRQTTPEILLHGNTFKTGWIPTEEQIAKATEKYNSFMAKGILSGEEASAQGAVVSQDSGHAGNVSVFVMSRDAKDTDKIFEEAAKNCLNSSFSVALERPTISHITTAADDRSRFLKENKHEEIQLRCRNTVFIVLVMTPSDIAEVDESSQGIWSWMYDQAKSVKDRWLEKKLFPRTAPWYEDRIRNINQTIFSRMIKKGGFFTMALAIAILCFCPPERETPLSPIIVSYPSARLAIKSWALAAFAASLNPNFAASSNDKESESTA